MRRGWWAVKAGERSQVTWDPLVMSFCGKAGR